MGTFELFKAHLTRITDLKMISSMMNWDMETYMPEKGGFYRGQQMATLSGIIHQMAIDPRLGKWIAQLQKDNQLNAVQKRSVALAKRGFERSGKYNEAFVVELSTTISASHQAWQKARAADDFSIFAPMLEKIVSIKRRECEILGYQDHPYDALIDQFEPGTTTAEVDTLFTEVRAQLMDFVHRIQLKQTPEVDFLYAAYPTNEQWDYGLALLQQMGYDFKAGRQDVSAHPFSTTFSPEDVRITTRVEEKNFYGMVWSCIHEGGHALYEQGMPTQYYGLPVCEYVSLGIHESQSRLWENNVGRSMSFWQNNFDALKNRFPEQLNGVSLSGFYRAINAVRPSLIRTHADELTYHFHILIRYKIEKALIEGSLEVRDLPAYWNACYKEYLGIDVPSDAEGVLQDIHWSHGSFGYFPTYSIGSFYAAQFYHQATKDIDNLEDEIASGNLKPLLGWLRKNIHQHGKMYTARELCERTTGEPLSFQYFMDYAFKKYGALYDMKVENVL